MSIAKNKTVLVVDDDALNQELMEAMLSLGNYHVQMTYTGQKALDMIHTSPPDILILDIKLPDIDGIEIAHRLKRNPNTQHIPIIMVTAYEDTSLHQAARDAGASTVLIRPIDTDDLLNKISQYLA